MQEPISITAISSISPLGYTQEMIWKSYIGSKHCFSAEKGDLVASLSEDAKKEIKKLKKENPTYKKLDKSVLYALYASRNAIKKVGWKENDFGINIGSSRGATELFENYYLDFLKNNKTYTLASPTTTLGNISSWVAHDIQTNGPTISHSITCSTALHAMLNGIAWINSGMSNKFLVGGSEAPLTPFTIAQMKALKVYCKLDIEALEMSNYYPNQALNLEKEENTMILGEGAAVACLEKGFQEDALAIIEGFGYATETLIHPASLSAKAECFQKSMTMALGTKNPEEIDIIITHTPGTIKGDLAEYNAIKKVFNNNIPSLTNNKWKLGHTLGPSGLFNIEMAIYILNNQSFIEVPFIKQKQPDKIKHILVNAVGFGGNAVSILLSK